MNATLSCACEKPHMQRVHASFFVIQVQVRTMALHAATTSADQQHGKPFFKQLEAVATCLLNNSM